MFGIFREGSVLDIDLRRDIKKKKKIRRKIERDTQRERINLT